MSRRLHRRRPIRTLIVIGLAALAVLTPTAALATPPDTERVPHEDHFIYEGASAACGFPVQVDVSGVQTFQVLFDAGGNPIRLQIHATLRGRFLPTGSPSGRSSVASSSLT